MVNDQFALTGLPSASRAPLLSEISNAWPAASGWSGVTDSWVDFSFHVILPATSAPVTVSVTRSALFVAERSIRWLNHIEMLAGSTSMALRRGSVFVSCALDWTMNEKLPSPPRALPFEVVRADHADRVARSRAQAFAWSEDEAPALPRQRPIDLRG